MIEINPISLATAGQLLDFAGHSAVAQAGAAAQLEGAVAVHNLLARPGARVAYLADEVGMGKTYVLLGTVALLRHYYPQLRVLYIVPKANLQEKWRKEIRNFTANNWRIVDHRVKSFQGTPVVEPVLCENLLDLVHKVALDAHRDFILRLSSFSLPLSRHDASKWKQKRDELREIFPGLAEKALHVDGRSPDANDRRKDAFACAVNDLLPHFDLLVLDEGHNLKHGFDAGYGAARNRLLAYALGTQPGPGGRPLERRIDRAIILSATPVDNSFGDLWNQLDLLGVAGPEFEPLKQEDREDDQARAAAARCLIRRLTHLNVDGKPHTRNMYRREWRGGGVATHDQPLQVPDDLQRLIVALMQKKVADVLTERARQEQKKAREEQQTSRGKRKKSQTRQKRRSRFSRSFQIGMLASFESFNQTAGLPGEDGYFDQTEQTEDLLERKGIDTSEVKRIAQHYRRAFQDSLPHPKMDAVVEDLWRGVLAGRKSLVFVRRIYSVPEMVEKLTKKYNEWLIARLREELRELPEAERQRFDKAAAEYEQQRTEFYSRAAAAAFAGGLSGRTPGDSEIDVDDDTERGAEAAQRREPAEPSGFESFFSWFFRGQGPPGILSGGALSRNRLVKESAALSTLFEDNWTLWLLGYPPDPFAALAERCGLPADQLASRLQARAAAIHGADKVQKRRAFHAYQRAALELLERRAQDPALKKAAGMVLDQHGWRHPQEVLAPERSFPEPSRYLGLRTFFTELAQREELRAALWPSGNSAQGTETDFLQREQRRVLLSSVARLGHPIIDLWLLHARLTRSLAGGRAEDADLPEEESPAAGAGTPFDLLQARAFLDLLERQRTSAGVHDGPTSFAELHRLATEFSLLADVNFDRMRHTALSELPTYFGDQIGQQQPIAGMYGGVSRRTVRQFRMPGYPFVLVTTDVLQEGEDLHTFCDRVVHYGISWTPSATEQRIGRVDRVGSLVQRRLAGAAAAQPAGAAAGGEPPLRGSNGPPPEDDLLQVYFPYLRETYEYVQVGIVFNRLNRFLEMLHDLRTPRLEQGGEVDVGVQILERQRDAFQPYREPLRSGFEIPEDLKPAGPPEPILQPANERILDHFDALLAHLEMRFSIEWKPAASGLHERRGKARVCDGQLLKAGQTCRSPRVQPFTLTLRTTHGGKLLLRCASPLGTVSKPQLAEVSRLQRSMPRLKLCAEGGENEHCYSLFVQNDLLFSSETTQPEEVECVFAATVAGADQLEKRIFDGKDHTEAELYRGDQETGDHGKN